MQAYLQIFKSVSQHAHGNNKKKKERERRTKQKVRLNYVKKHSKRPMFSHIYLVQEELEVNR